MTIPETISRFDSNYARSQNLVDLYEKHLKGKGQGRRDALATDPLRAAIVFLHAALEDFVRSVCVLRFPITDAEQVSKIPLAGANQKHAAKFALGEMIQHSNQNVGELIHESIREYFHNFSTFNNIGQIISNLQMCGLTLDDTQFSAAVINEMIERRHNIVHRADTNPNVGGQGQHSTKSIGVWLVRNYLAEVKRLVDHIGHLLSE